MRYVREAAVLGVLLGSLCRPLAGAGDEAEQINQTRADLLKSRDVAVAAKNGEAAIAFGEKITALDRQQLALAEKTVGPEKLSLERCREQLAASLDWLGDQYERSADLANALSVRKESLGLNERLTGARHIATANSLYYLGRLHRVRGDTVAAQPLCQRASSIRIDILGLKHPDTLAALAEMLLLSENRGDYEQANLLLEAIAGNPTAIRPLNLTRVASPAPIYKSASETAVADTIKPPIERLLTANARDAASMAASLRRRAVAACEAACGSEHRNTVYGLESLALVYSDYGDTAKALPVLQQALMVAERDLGPQHPDTAQILNHIANVYADQGDHAAALRHYHRALAIREKALGPNHLDTLKIINNLAIVYKDQGDLTKAQQFFERVLAAHQKAMGTEHAETSFYLTNLASLYSDQGKYDRAVELHQQSLAICRREFGPNHPRSGVALANLAWTLLERGDCATAMPLSEQATAILEKTLGPNHLDTAICLNNSANACQRLGAHARAAELADRAAAIARRSLELAAGFQSEREQLVMARRLRYQIDWYLTLAVRAGLPAERPYSQILAWKGAIAVRQQAARMVASDRNHQALVALRAELNEVTARLTSLALQVPEPRDRETCQRTIAGLGERREEVERELMRRSLAFREEAIAMHRTPADVQKALPPDHVLVDFLAFNHHAPPREGRGPDRCEAHLAAFVVRRDRPIVMLELGALDPIAAAIEKWRQAMPRRITPLRGPGDPAVVLRKRLLEPLLSHLIDARHVLISPDGALNWLAWSALPGKDPAKYLLEEIGVSILPVPRLLPGRSDHPSKPRGKPSMLLIGDLDFDARPAPQPVRSDVPGSGMWQRRRAGGLPQWPKLPGTRGEVLAIADSFRRAAPGGDAKSLRDDEATELVVRREICTHTYLHFATHGFFADAGLPSSMMSSRKSRGPEAEFCESDQLSGLHPGLLSGLALSGANQPRADGEDGVLTALELTELDMRNVELAVLSACDTGLGQVAGGEGVLGLQRAFQVAGARSVVTSLWKVDDEATRILMERCYENYWRKRLPLADSLREAQLRMLQEGATRGMIREDAESLSGTVRRTPPCYWAAFVLSGDWR